MLAKNIYIYNSCIRHSLKCVTEIKRKESYIYIRKVPFYCAFVRWHKFYILLFYVFSSFHRFIVSFILYITFIYTLSDKTCIFQYRLMKEPCFRIHRYGMGIWRTLGITRVMWDIFNIIASLQDRVSYSVALQSVSQIMWTQDLHQNVSCGYTLRC